MITMHRGASRNTYDGKIAGLYDLEETLGRGHFAVVKLARHVFTGEKVAVKVIDKSKLDEISRAHLFQEVRCMKLVQHPNVVRLYEVIDTQTKLYLILELGDGGDLYDYIMRHDGGLGEELAREYFRQIVRAISYCHRLHVVHRDLKPENVVFFERLRMVKLTDFGFSNRFNPGQKLETSCGSLAYSAPEILLGDSYDAPAVDVWSLGVILYMLVCGQAPFQEANDSETLTMIMDCKYTIPVHVSEACKRLIARMLIREPERRASLEQIAEDPWLGEDLSAQPADFLPLISREHVSDDDHALIIQKMVNGNIASKEEILEALEKNEYNHITATYFLLAERKLRAHRQELGQARQMIQGTPGLSPISPGKPYVKVENSLIQEQDSPTQVNQALLSVSLTPGDVPQNYRARKCSIVQEEEDEDDMSSCSVREELVPPHCSLNRRGSRSEGKLNLALQERLAESERRKEQGPAATQPAGRVDITRTVAKDDTSKPRLTTPSLLPTLKKSLPLNNIAVRPKSSTQPSNKPFTAPTYLNVSSKCRQSLKQTATYSTARSVTTTTSSVTTVITESSTISIPVHATPSLTGTTLVPKYKTMPSPTRSMQSVISSPQLALNEIFEEGDGSGVSDVTTPHSTPRTFVSRQQGQPRTGGYAQRRSKFHKTRTASCSSSDASDDDSESRKKRAHKLGGDGKSLPQRRDSHDDSSDSQDPGGSSGTGGGSGAGGGGTFAGGAECGGGPSSTQTAGVSDGSRTSSGSGTGGTGGHRQCSDSTQNLPFGRRHRAGRRRSGETRLRESQSLNRITEVQEAEHITSQTCHNHTTVVVSTSVSASRSTSSSSPKVRGFGARLLQSWSLTSSSKKPVVLQDKNNSFRNPCCTISEDKSNLQQCASEGEEAGSLLRVGSSLLKDDRNEIKVPNGAITEGPQMLATPTRSVSSGSSDAGATNCSTEEKENYCKSPNTKLSREKHAREKPTSESGGKKVRLLGRYFQVHKKLCLPLPGLFGRGRLYKAQSCSSIVRERVAPPSPASLLLCGDDRWCPVAGKGSDDNNGNMGEHDGDINQNVGPNEGVVSDSMVPLGAACPGIGICHIHLGDASKCCNLC